MDVYQATIERRSIRWFQHKPVPYDILERCADAARMAPNGHNHQIMEFLIIDDEKKLPDVQACFHPPRDAHDLRDMAPPDQRPKAYFIILINTVLEADTGAPRWAHMISVGMAAENAILVALENGVSTCPQMGFNAQELKKALEIPDKYDIGVLISMGYSNESAVAEESTGSVERWIDDQGVRHIPKRKLVDILHRNRFV